MSVEIKPIAWCWNFHGMQLTADKLIAEEVSSEPEAKKVTALYSEDCIKQLNSEIDRLRDLLETAEHAAEQLHRSGCLLCNELMQWSLTESDPNTKAVLGNWGHVSGMCIDRYFIGVKRYSPHEWAQVQWSENGFSERDEDQPAVNAFLRSKDDPEKLKRFFYFMGWDWIDETKQAAQGNNDDHSATGSAMQGIMHRFVRVD